MRDEDRPIFKRKRAGVDICKACRKYPPAPRDWLCGTCKKELLGRDPLDDERIARIAREHQAERSKPAPAMGYTVRKK